ncbi:MAG: hypothetical protein ACRDFB_11065 [Rhabdochlamydiaceae bacterium]
MTNCKNCNRSLEPTENDAGHSTKQRQMCHDQLLSKIAKKWGLVTSIVFTSLFLACIAQVASAQEATTFQIFSGNVPLEITDQTVNIISEPAGSYIHGTVTGGTFVKSDMSNFIQQTVSYDTITFSGVTLPYQTSLTIGSKTIIFQVAAPVQELPYDLQPIDIIVAIVVIVIAVGLMSYISKRKVSNRGWSR